MKKSLKNIGAILLVLTLCMTMFAPAAFASGFNTTDLTASVELSGTIVNDENYVIKLKADDASYPMPEGSVDGAYTMTISGEGSVHLPALDFNELGVYTYTVWQEPGMNEFGTYDETVYNVKFTVTNNSDYSGLDVTPAIYAKGNNEDKSEIIFKNDYANPYTELSVEKVWYGDEDELENRPEYIKVALLNGGKVVEKVTLSEENNWKYKWTKLSVNGEWNVAEIDVPAGYKESYSEKDKDNKIIITNAKKLKQTGQLNWPVPVLGGAGIVLIAFGFIMNRKRKVDEK